MCLFELVYTIIVYIVYGYIIYRYIVYGYILNLYNSYCFSAAECHPGGRLWHSG